METGRLRLAELDPEADAAEFNTLIVDSFDSLHPWLSWAEKVPTIDETRQRLEKAKEHRTQGTKAKFGIYLKESRTLIGTCGVIALRGPIGDRTRDKIDSPQYKNPWLLSYWIGKRYEGRGYATEACAAMMDWGIREFSIDCYFAEVFTQNAKSAALLKRLGFEYWDRTTSKNSSRSDWPEEVPCDIYRKCV